MQNSLMLFKPSGKDVSLVYLTLKQGPVILGGMFILDTGATHSILDIDAASKVGIKATGGAPISFKTANGETKLFPPAEVSLGIGSDFTIPSHEFYVGQIVDDLLVAGILGLDVLNKFNYTLTNDSLILEAKK